MRRLWSDLGPIKIYRCHLFSIFPFFNGQPSMVSAVLFVSKDHTAVLLCDPNLTEELKDKTHFTLRNISCMVSLTWCDLFTSSHCSAHLTTCTQMGASSRFWQIQIQKGKDKYRKAKTIYNYKAQMRTWTGRLLVSLTLTLRACQS